MGDVPLRASDGPIREAGDGEGPLRDPRRHDGQQRADPRDHVLRPRPRRGPPDGGPDRRRVLPRPHPREHRVRTPRGPRRAEAPARVWPPVGRGEPRAVRGRVVADRAPPGPRIPRTRRRVRRALVDGPRVGARGPRAEGEGVRVLRDLDRDRRDPRIRGRRDRLRPRRAAADVLWPLVRTVGGRARRVPDPRGAGGGAGPRPRRRRVPPVLPIPRGRRRVRRDLCPVLPPRRSDRPRSPRVCRPSDLSHGLDLRNLPPRLRSRLRGGPLSERRALGPARPPRPVRRGTPFGVRGDGPPPRPGVVSRPRGAYCGGWAPPRAGLSRLPPPP